MTQVVPRAFAPGSDGPRWPLDSGELGEQPSDLIATEYDWQARGLLGTRDTGPSGVSSTRAYKKSNAASAWFCVDELTRFLIARLDKKADTSALPILVGCLRS